MEKNKNDENTFCERKEAPYTQFKNTRPLGYKTFFMFNSAEHKISTADKN